MPDASDECPDDRVLGAYARGELAGGPVARHVEACARCGKRAVELAPTGVSRPRPVGHALPAELTDSGEYEDVVELGRGGMGVVYKARNTLMDRVEVLKVMGREVMARPGAADRFRREIQSAARLSHPNVVGAYAARMVGGLLVFSMEYVPGEDFYRLVKDRGALPVAHAALYAKQVADGLQHAHEQGMVHRDIKPANLILSRDGKRPVVKILDFGLARLTSEDDGDRRLTVAGKMMGTPDYVSPEQALDAQTADTRSDIYSLGCTLYFFLTGRPPFQAGTVVGVLLQHRDATAEHLHTVRPDVPAELAAVVARMMEKKPENRYQTPAEAAAALAPFTRPGAAPPPRPVAAVPVPPSTWVVTPVSPGPDPVQAPSMTVVHAAPSAWDSLPSSQSADAGYAPRRRRRRQPVWPLAVTVAVAGVVVAAAVLWLSNRPRPTPEPAPGALVLADLPPNTVVEIDGKRVLLTRDGADWVGDLPAAGRHRVRVLRGAQELHSETIDVDDPRERVTVRVPLRASFVPPPTGAVPTSKGPPPVAPGPPAAPAVLTGDRVRWVHSQGKFEWRGGLDWDELAANGVTHRYRETLRTAAMIELQHVTQGIRARLYADQCELSVTGQAYWKAFTGNWVTTAADAGAAAPTFPLANLLLDRTFTREAVETTPSRHGETGGHYVIDCPKSGSNSAWNIGDVPADFAVEAVGRVWGGATGSWGLNVTNIQSVPLHGLQVMLNGKGELSVARGMFERDLMATGPTAGPLTHPALKAGSEYNTLLLVLKGRVLDVYVNGTRLVGGLKIDRDVSPARIAMTGAQDVTATPAPVLAEFRRVRTWTLDAAAAGPPAVPPIAKGPVDPPAVATPGVWSIDGNELVGTAVTAGGSMGAYIEFGDPSWSDVDFSFEVKRPLTTQKVGAFCRIPVGEQYGVGMKSWVECNIGTNLGGVAARREIAPGPATYSPAGMHHWKGRPYPGFTEGPRAAPGDEWVRMRLRVVDRTIDFDLDGRTWGRIPVFTTSRWSGKLGLVVCLGTARFRNIRVLSATGAELWNRLPTPPP